MPPTTDTEIRELILSLREEMRVGFANVDTKLAEIRGDIQKVESKIEVEVQKLDSKIDRKFVELDGKINVLNERTRLGFWGFSLRALAIAVMATVAKFSFDYFYTGTVNLKP